MESRSRTLRYEGIRPPLIDGPDPVNLYAGTVIILINLYLSSRFHMAAIATALRFDCGSPSWTRNIRTRAPDKTVYESGREEVSLKGLALVKSKSLAPNATLPSVGSCQPLCSGQNTDHCRCEKKSRSLHHRLTTFRSSWKVSHKNCRSLESPCLLRVYFPRKFLLRSPRSGPIEWWC
jgi:hypothetical protein